MNKLSILSAGVALGVTLALMSMLCALAFAIWPDTTLDFFGAFMHGLDFSPIRLAAQMSPGRVLYGVVGLGVVGLVAGVVYASIYNVVATGRRYGGPHESRGTRPPRPAMTTANNQRECNR